MSHDNESPPYNIETILHQPEMIENKELIMWLENRILYYISSHERNCRCEFDSRFCENYYGVKAKKAKYDIVFFRMCRKCYELFWKKENEILKEMKRDKLLNIFDAIKQELKEINLGIKHIISHQDKKELSELIISKNEN